MTPDDAIANAVRLAQAAEGETDRALMEQMTTLATFWLDAAWLLIETQ